MEVGFSKIEGIRYSDLKKQIETDMGRSMGRNTEAAFVLWIMEVFEPDGSFPRFMPNYKIAISNDVRSGKLDSASRNFYNRFSKTIWVIKGTTVKQYLDYIELQESRKAAIQAKKQSSISIWIAIFALVVSSVLGIYSMVTAPIPPYDVKVIENKTRVEQLEKENGELRDELHNTKMMLEAYKSDSL